MVTAYVAGPSLAAAVAERGPLGATQAQRLGAALAEGLAAIHACGLVHRDLKPSNIILADDGARIIDFGIARAAGASALTSAGTVIGTFAYMSPEQIMGRPVGAPSDIFALGAVLAYAATGQGPFDAETIPTITYRILSEPPDLTGLEGPLRQLVEECLRKAPEQRPALGDLLTRLAVLAREPAAAPAAPVPVPPVAGPPVAAPPEPVPPAPSAPQPPRAPVRPSTARATRPPRWPSPPTAACSRSPATRARNCGSPPPRSPSPCRLAATGTRLGRRSPSLRPALLSRAARLQPARFPASRRPAARSWPPSPAGSARPGSPALRSGCGTWPPCSRWASRSGSTPWSPASTCGSAASDVHRQHATQHALIWHADTTQPGGQLDLPGPVRITFSPDSRFFAASCADRTIRLWDMRAPAPPLFLSSPGGYGPSSAPHRRRMAFSPDARLLATADHDGTRLRTLA